MNLPHASSVNVPVLSKTIIFTLPAVLTHDGDIQKMFFCFNLSIANRVPVIIAVGNEGGTKVVIRFNPLSVTSQVDQSSMNL